jgi:hypothetical protein
MEFFLWSAIVAHKKKHMNIINDQSVSTQLVSAIVIGSLLSGTLLNAGERASENIRSRTRRTLSDAVRA